MALQKPPHSCRENHFGSPYAEGIATLTNAFAPEQLC